MLHVHACKILWSPSISLITAENAKSREKKEKNNWYRTMYFSQSKLNSHVASIWLCDAAVITVVAAADAVAVERADCWLYSAHMIYKIKQCFVWMYILCVHVQSNALWILFSLNIFNAVVHIGCFVHFEIAYAIFIDTHRHSHASHT